MRLIAFLNALLAFSVLTACNHTPKVTSRVLSTERFGELRVWQAEGDPETAVIYFSQGSIWKSEEATLSELIARSGQLVIGVNSGSYLETLSKDSGSCLLLAGEIERLGQSVQSGLGLKQVHPLVLLGTGEGGLFAKTALEQHPSPFLAGIVQLAESRPLNLNVPFCPPEANAHYVLDMIDEERSLSPQEIVEKIETIVPAHLQRDASHEALSDLPLRFIPPKKDKIGLVVFYSGDGGWASIDKALADYLSKHGFEVVGFDSLKYFWKRKDPERATQDLLRVLSAYSEERVFLGGFSLGAEVLPFIAARLPEPFRERIAGMFLLSAGQSTDFEIHISDWVGFDDDENDSPIAPEFEKLKDLPLCCLSGETDDKSLCAQLSPKKALIKQLSGGHHFDGDYARVGATLTDFLTPLLKKTAGVTGR